MIAAALYQERDDHKAIIATMTASMLFQYTIKALIFGLLGFSFAAYGEIILAMFLAAIAGTFIGRHILLNAPQDFIRPIQKMLVTALGIKVLLDGLEGYWFS